MDFSIVQKHPYVIAGGLVGVVVLYLLYRSSAANGSSGTSAPNPQLAAIDAAATLQQQQIQEQQNVAQLQADVANNQIAAGVQNTQATLDAQLQAVNLTTGADVAKTQIEGDTISNVVSTQASVKLAQVQLQQKIYATLASQKKLGGSSTGVSQIISALYGEGPQAIAANQPAAAASSPGAILSGISGVAKALFG